MFKFVGTILSAAVMLGTSWAGVKSVEFTPVTIPVMIHQSFNPIIGLNLKSEGDTDKITAFMLSVKGVRPNAIESISIHKSKVDDKGAITVRGGAGELIGSINGTEIKNGNALIRCDYSPSNGDNYIWISVSVLPTARVGGSISLDLKGIRGIKAAVSNISTTQRIGVSVTSLGQETTKVDVQTGKEITTRKSKFFRIPGLDRTKKGTLIAVFDNRYNHNGDLPADIDVGISRSTNGGQTWSPIKTCINASDIEGIGKGVGDPSILVCQRTNRIWVAALAAPKSGHPIWKSIAGSTSPEVCGQLILAHSDDEGLTWSKPINVTESVKRLNDPDTKEWACLFNGPGNGLSMRNGTLVFAGQIWGTKRQGVLVYSKDRGKTWTSSKGMEFGASESQVVELSDGSLLMNTREGISGLRQVGHTKDMGETWTKHPSARSDQGKLFNSFCQAGTISLFNAQGKNGRTQYNLGKGVNHALFFSAPSASTARRAMMRLRYSLDDGNSWSEGLLYDQRSCMGYSAIAPVDRDNIGVLYESEIGHLYFIKFPFSEVLKVPLQK